MTAHRLPIAVALVVALLPALLGSSCSQPEYPACNTPTLDEKAADGGPDPCHCDPPPSLNILACECLTGTQDFIDAYNACMVLYRIETDAGVD